MGNNEVPIKMEVLGELSSASDFPSTQLHLGNVRKFSNLPVYSTTFDVATVDSVGQVIEIRQESNSLFTERLDLEINIEMIVVPGDFFLMGTADDKDYKNDDETPQHYVKIKTFLLSRYPITQAQWRYICDLPRIERDLQHEPSYFSGENQPVETVSWLDAVEFCARLSCKTNRPYRLPCEAEWEYACRAKTDTPFHYGETITPRLANFKYNYDQENEELSKTGTSIVNKFQFSNQFGLHDMHGNVWEWCADTWHASYEKAPTVGETWVVNGEKNIRVIRGGSWNSPIDFCRSSYRNNEKINFKGNGVGFRIACSINS